MTKNINRISDRYGSLVTVPDIGEQVSEGWKYAGISPTTNLPLFVSYKDEPIGKAWLRAVGDAVALKNYNGFDGSQDRTCEQLLEAIYNKTHDHGVRLATYDELEQNLYPNRKAIGGFNEDPRSSLSYYWSSDQGVNFTAYAKNFATGQRAKGLKTNEPSIRLVRS